MALSGFLKRAHMGSIERRVHSYCSRILAKTAPSLVAAEELSALSSSEYLPVSMHSCRAVGGGGLTIVGPAAAATLATELLGALGLLLLPLPPGIFHPTR
jgi:hypothetical protein